MTETKPETHTTTVTFYVPIDIDPAGCLHTVDITGDSESIRCLLQFLAKFNVSEVNQ